MLALLFTALSLVPGGAHALEFGHKIGLSREDYAIVQRLYLGWQFMGIAVVGALLLNGGLAAMLRHNNPAFNWSIAATLFLVLSLAIFFTWTFPVNQTTVNWTILPANWEALRRQWEYSHLVNEAVSLLAFVCLTVSVVLTAKQT